MADELPPLFDAHIHPRGLSNQDLESLRYFGVTGALVAADATPHGNAEALFEHFQDIVKTQLPRLEAAGIRAYAALGLHPGALPRRGLSEVLAALPGYFQRGKVVAVGAVGLSRGTHEEEEAFTAQLELARKLKLPALVHTPVKDKTKHTRRILALLRESGLAPSQVLVDHASAATVRPILELGYWAGLTVHPEELKAERVAALVKKHGSQQLVVDTDAGHGASDMLALARTASLLMRGGLSEQVVRRVTFDNARRLFRVGR